MARTQASAATLASSGINLTFSSLSISCLWLFSHLSLNSEKEEENNFYSQDLQEKRSYELGRL